MKDFLTFLSSFCFTKTFAICKTSIDKMKRKLYTTVTNTVFNVIYLFKVFLICLTKIFVM